MGSGFRVWGLGTSNPKPLNPRKFPSEAKEPYSKLLRGLTGGLGADPQAA